MHNDESNANRQSPNSFKQERRGRSRPSARPLNGFANHDTSAADGSPQFSAADALPFLEALRRHWWWLAAGGAAFALVGFLFSIAVWKDSYTASAQLLRQEPERLTEVLGERELASDTYASLLRAPELLQRVA